MHVALRLRGVVLGLTGRVLLLARLRPRLRPGEVPDSLDRVALRRVPLAGGLAMGGGGVSAWVRRGYWRLGEGNVLGAAVVAAAEEGHGG